MVAIFPVEVIIPILYAREYSCLSVVFKQLIQEHLFSSQRDCVQWTSHLLKF